MIFAFLKVGGFELILILIITLLPLIALIDILRSRFGPINKLVWVLVVFLLFIIISTPAYAQLTQEGYINDADGYTNVRREPASTTDMARVNEGEMFFYQKEKESNWWPVTTTNGTIGFIHNSRIVDVQTAAVDIQKLFVQIKTANPNDVEFGEGSNEQLFKYAEKYPKSFVIAYQKSNREIRELIIKEMESPIHDLIPLALIYQRIKNLNIEQQELLTAIELAASKIGLELTEN